MRTAHRLKQLAAVASDRRVVRDILGALARGAFADAGRAARTVVRTPDLGAEKVVSRKHRFVWLCVPKAASRSVAAALREADPDAEVVHDKSISEVYAMRPEARSYYSFAFVRHPFDRALSLYVEMRFHGELFEGRHRLLKERRQIHLNAFHGLGEVRSFDDYCLWLNTPYGSDRCAERHFLSQGAQIRLPDGRLPDFVGCLENLDEDFGRVAMRLGMTAPRLPVFNTMAGWNPPPEALKVARARMGACLTERNRALLAARYAADIELHRDVSRAGSTRDMRRFRERES